MSVQIQITLNTSSHELPAGSKLQLLHVDDFSQIDQSANNSIGELSGISKVGLKDFDILKCNDLVIRIDKIGKKLKKAEPSITEQMLAKNGIFCTVMEGTSSNLDFVFTHEPKIFKSMVITLSDRAFKGEYDDLSGPVVMEELANCFEEKGKRFETVYRLIPDSREELLKILNEAKHQFDVIITTGGTGIGPRDFTVDVVQPLLDMEIPGIMEMIRMKHGMKKPNAYLSRGVAGVFGQSLIYTLPGSVRAVKEYMEEISKTLDHLFYMKAGIDVH